MVHPFHAPVPGETIFLRNAPTVFDPHQCSPNSEAMNRSGGLIAGWLDSRKVTDRRKKEEIDTHPART